MNVLNFIHEFGMLGTLFKIFLLQVSFDLMFIAPFMINGMERRVWEFPH